MKPQTGKFYMRWDGLYTIVDKLSDLNYLIRKTDSNTPFVVHVNRLKAWKGNNEEIESTSSALTETELQIDTQSQEKLDQEKVNESETAPRHIDNTRLTEGQEITNNEQPTKRGRGRPRKTAQEKAPPTPRQTEPETKTTKYNLRTKTKKPTRFI